MKKRQGDGARNRGTTEGDSAKRQGQEGDSARRGEN